MKRTHLAGRIICGLLLAAVAGTVIAGCAITAAVDAEPAGHSFGSSLGHHAPTGHTIEEARP